MTWETFNNDAFALTEREISQIERDIIGIYTQAEKDVAQQIRVLYSEVLAGVKPEDYYNTVIKYDRLNNLLDSIQADLMRYTRQANKDIQTASTLGMSNVYYRKMYAAGWLVPEIATGILPPALVEMTVYGTAAKWKELTQKTLEKIYGSKGLYMPKTGTLIDILTKRRNDLIYGVRDEIARGLVQGKHFKEMRDAVAVIIGKVTPEGTTGALANAMRIVRSESIRTMNAGGYAQAMYLKSQGVNIQRLWSSALDTRTRATHGALDGKIHEIDDPFCIGDDCSFYPGNFANAGNNANCRCRVVDTINNELPQIRRGRNPVEDPKTGLPTGGENSVFSYKTFPQWMADNNLTRNKSGVIVFKK